MNAAHTIAQLRPQPYTGVVRPAVTVATIVERDGRFLLIEEETRNGVRLNQPAGHVEVGESIVGAAARETLEEAAWRVDPTALVGIYQWQSPDSGTTFVRFTFAAAPRRHEPNRPLDTGILRALWLSYEEIAARRDLHRNPLVLRSLDDYRAGTRWPLGVIANL
jgi:8-oxo-dGTP pyrophosphatase MutT (NUDIX family)